MPESVTTECTADKGTKEDKYIILFPVQACKKALKLPANHCCPKFNFKMF